MESLRVSPTFLQLKMLLIEKLLLLLILTFKEKKMMKMMMKKKLGNEYGLLAKKTNPLLFARMQYSQGPKKSVGGRVVYSVHA